VHHGQAFPRKRFVKSSTSRFRGDAYRNGVLTKTSFPAVVLRICAWVQG